MGKFKIIIAFAAIITAFGYALASCKKDDPSKSDKKEIISFVLVEQEDSAQIDTENKTITVKVKYNADLAKLSPVISVSEKATINPASGVSVNFSSGSAKYTVTAEDKSTSEWTVKVTKSNEMEKKILSFTISGQNSTATIKNDSVNMVLEPSVDLSSLTPVITVSEGTVISPASGISVDFSKGPVKYTITAEDGSSKDWIVKIVKRELFTGFLVNSFTISGQVSSGGAGGTNIRVVMPTGTDISSLTPTILTSPGATITPSSGVAQDFSKGEIAYTVTSESGRKSIWNVMVTYPFTAANSPNIKYIGRIDLTTPTSPKFSAPGVYLVTKFTGPVCDVDITDERGMNYIVAVIDDNPPVRIALTSGSKTYRLASGLTNTEHKILICKETESGVGYIEINGFRCGELKAATDIPTRKMEFYGNSITAGSCMLNEYCNLVANNTNWNAANSAYRSYGAVTARALNAQWQITGISGIGLINSCCNMGYTMPNAWDRVFLTDGSSAKWDFTKYVPEVVTICLGQNDGPSKVSSKEFNDAYVTLINNMRSKYANASIFCLTSPMADATLLAAMNTALTTVVDSVNKAGDTKVYKVTLPNGLVGGCPSNPHPNVAQHESVSAVLVTAIKEKMGW